MIKELFVFGLMVIFMCSCSSDQSKNIEINRGSELNKPLVEVVNPVKRNYSSQLEITGTMEANQTVLLHAMESGFVISITKDIGDFVSKGTIISSLENPNLTQSFETSKANFNFKKSLYDRIKNIYDETPDLTTIEDLEEAKAEYESAKAVYDANDMRLQYLNVKAPFSGYVTKRFVDKGSLVQSGLVNTKVQAIVEIQDISVIRLVVDYPESDIELIEKGNDVKVIVPELSNLEINGKINRVSNALNPETKTMRVEIDLSNRNNRLKPGMYAKVSLTLKEHGSLSVPIMAISGKKEKNYIYIVKNQVVQKMDVSLGIEDKEYIEVINRSLKHTDQVVIKGKEMISVGLKVNVKNLLKDQD